MTFPSKATRVRLLLVEDDRSHAGAIINLLGEGFEVVHALDGREARARLAADDAFDVILSDIMMPRVTGFALLDWVRTEKPALEHRVVFVTTDPEGSLARCLGKTHRVLRKPLSADDLHRAVREVTSGR